MILIAIREDQLNLMDWQVNESDGLLTHLGVSEVTYDDEKGTVEKLTTYFNFSKDNGKYKVKKVDVATARAHKMPPQIFDGPISEVPEGTELYKFLDGLFKDNKFAEKWKKELDGKNITNLKAEVYQLF